MTLGVAILAVSHLGLYVFLTGDARTHMDEVTSQFSTDALETARRPGPPPDAGTPAYSPWLRAYEQWHASETHGLHARHEGMIRFGMILSFVIGLGLVGASVHRSAPHRRRGRSVDARPAPARVAVRPVRAAAASARIAATPVRVTARPARAAPKPVPVAVGAVAPVRPLRPAAARPTRVRRSA